MNQVGKRIRHTGIVTLDMDKSLSFYRDILGFEVQSDEVEKGHYVDQMMGVQNQSFRAVKMTLPEGGMLEILEFEKKGEGFKEISLNDSGMTHFAIQVSNLDELHKNLTNEGYQCVNPPAETENKYAKVLFCREPNGHFVELVEVL